MRNNTGYISMGELVSELWKRKISICMISALTAVFAVVFSLRLPDIYKSTALLVPNEKEQANSLAGLASQFGGIASLAGVDLNSGNNNAALALEIVKSNVFLTYFIDKYQLKKELFASSGWVRETDTLLFDEDIYDINKKEWVREVKLPYLPEPNILEVIEKFKEESLIISKDDETGVVYLSVLTVSPLMSQTIARNLVNELNVYMRERDIESAEKSIVYLQQAAQATKLSDMRSVFYQLIQQQVQTKMIAETQTDYVFQVVDPAIVPLEKHKPSRAVIVILSFIVGFILSVVFIIFKIAIKLKG